MGGDQVVEAGRRHRCPRRVHCQIDEAERPPPQPAHLTVARSSASVPQPPPSPPPFSARRPAIPPLCPTARVCHGCNPCTRACWLPRSLLRSLGALSRKPARAGGDAHRPPELSLVVAHRVVGAGGRPRQRQRQRHQPGPPEAHAGRAPCPSQQPRSHPQPLPPADASRVRAR